MSKVDVSSILHVSEIKDEETDNVEYDSDVENNQGTTGMFAAVFIVVNAAMGAGLLNIPQAFKHAGGVGPGIGLEMCFLVFIMGSLMILGYCTHIYKQPTYQEVLEVVCGRLVGFLAEIFIILYMFGTGTAMIIIVGDQFDKVMEASVGPDFCHHWYMNRKFTMSVFSTAVILPLCIPKNIGFLKHASVVGVLGVIIVMLTVVVKFATSAYTPGVIGHSPRGLSEIMSAVPAIFFAYQCHVSSVPVYSSLKRKTSLNWFIVISLSIFLCALSYTLTGACGYLTFGDDVKSDVLQSYNATDTFVIVARMAIVATMLTSYPILQFCGRAALLTLLVKVGLFTVSHFSKKERLRRFSITFTWFFGSLALALFIPNIGEAIAVVGGLAGCFILVFPGLCLMMIADKSTELSKCKTRAMMAVGLFYIAIGTFLFGEITTEAIMNDVRITSPELSSNCYAS